MDASAGERPLPGAGGREGPEEGQGDGELRLPGASDRYERQELLGAGEFGEVFRAWDRELDRAVALKVMRLDVDGDGSGLPAHVLREVALLRDLRHPNVVEMLDVLVTHSECSLVLEHVEGDLHRVLRRHRLEGRRLPMPDVLSYAGQLLEGVRACHALLALHRDLKPQNLLLGPGGRLKICDFGLARLRAPGALRGSHTREIVSLWYRAPELLLGARSYGAEVDLWSVGCIVAEMAIGTVLLPGDCEIAQIYQIFQAVGTPTEESWPGHREMDHWSDSFPRWPPTGLSAVAARRPEVGEPGLDLMQALLSLCPAARLTARSALDHPWLSTAAPRP